MEKIILAYSGGLDTSVALHWLKNRGFNVVAFIADLGQKKNFKEIETRAKNSGASKVYILDLKKEFLEKYCFLSLKAGAIYEGKYLLSTALSRPLIAKGLVEIAAKENAHFVAHGSTGKGNDQVRFETSVKILNPRLEVIAPLRIWEMKSRKEEIEYARHNKIPIKVTRESPYSIDQNLWGSSIECGILEEPQVEPPSEAYQLTKDICDSPERPLYLELFFEKGIPKKLNGKSLSSVELVKRLNRVGAKFGVGRTDLIENRLIGIKSREIYEAPAATILYIAHQELEALVLDREISHFKSLVSLKYAQIIYYGLWFSALKQALDKFIEETQNQVTGKVRLKLYKGSCIPVGRNSPYSLYKKELATYGPEDRFDHKAAEGFIKIWQLPFINKF